MDYNNRRYLIIPTHLADSIDFSQVLETSIDTLRFSVDGTQTFVKYEINQTPTGEITGRPDIYSSQYDEYTHEQILEILSTEAWSSQSSEEIN